MEEKKGDYQNNIESLSSLNIGDYERIFRVYSERVDDKEFPFYNILNKIDLDSIDSEFVDFYNVTTRMPMTTISHKIYGDIKSWWIIYLMNKDKIQNPPFWVDGGVQLKYLKLEYRILLYNDITKNTIFNGRHF
jgi:hypothetical protein